MKYLKYFESKKDIDSICNRYGIDDYTVNPDGTVDVDGNVNLYNKGLDEIPLKFGYVSGYFDCGNNKLTSLEGSPREVGGYFDCRYNQLTSLVSAPEEVGDSFHCWGNGLTSLMGAPEQIGGDFDCDNNPNLPKEILDNMDYINKIVKYQNDYNIWRRDGSLDAYRFSDMMKEILEEEK